MKRSMSVIVSGYEVSNNDCVVRNSCSYSTVSQSLICIGLTGLTPCFYYLFA
jgi:hypothetical protein